MNTPALRLENLTVGIHGKEILGPVDFYLTAGEIGLLLGPNGSGKSTLLKTAVGLLPPLGGYVFVEGEDIHRLKHSERAREMAWVPQHEPSDFSFTVHEYVAMALLSRSQAMFESGGDFAIVQDALSQTGCQLLEDRLITELSGGERQRVMIARALAQQTPIILLDEPVSHLDISHQIEVIELIKQLAGLGKTILLSVHDFMVASTISGKALLINEGKVAFQGTYEDLINGDALEQVFDHPFERVQVSDGTYRFLPIYFSHH